MGFNSGFKGLNTFIQVPSPYVGVCETLVRYKVESSWNVTAHGDAREGKWRGNWRMKRVASTLHTTSEHGVSNITTADARTSAASSRLNWRPCQFKWTRPFRRKKKAGFSLVPLHFKRCLPKISLWLCLVYHSVWVDHVNLCCLFLRQQKCW